MKTMCRTLSAVVIAMWVLSSLTGASAQNKGGGPGGGGGGGKDIPVRVVYRDDVSDGIQSVGGAYDATERGVDAVIRRGSNEGKLLFCLDSRRSQRERRLLGLPAPFSDDESVKGCHNVNQFSEDHPDLADKDHNPLGFLGLDADDPSFDAWSVVGFADSWGLLFNEADGVFDGISFAGSTQGVVVTLESGDAVAGCPDGCVWRVEALPDDRARLVDTSATPVDDYGNVNMPFSMKVCTLDVPLADCAFP